MIFLSLLFFLSLPFLNLSCAKNIAPSGGESYKSHFYLTAISPSNLTTNLPKDISLHFKFSDWISTSILDNDILINPAIPKKLDFSISSHYLTIRFREPLIKNTTYRISFLPSLKSVHNIKLTNTDDFIFSTDSIIHQGSIKGNLKTSKPNLTYLGLYPHEVNPEILKTIIAPKHTKDNISPNTQFERPYYTIPVDSNGDIHFNTIKPGFYSVLAFIDHNKNLRPDISTEEIGVGAQKMWIDQKSSSITLNLNKIIQNPIQIKSVEWLPNEQTQDSLSFGYLKIIFNQSILDSSFNIIIQDTLKNQLRYSRTEWYQDYQKIFVAIDEPISKNKIYQVSFKNLLSTSYQNLDSNQNNIYFKYDSLFFHQSQIHTPQNFKWGQKHFSSKSRFIFESTFHLSPQKFIQLKKTFVGLLDTDIVPLYWRQLDPFHTEIVMKYIKEENQKFYFLYPTKDTVPSDILKLDTLGFIQLKENNKQGFIEINLPQKVQTQDPSKWKYQIKAKNSQLVDIRTISLNSIQNLLDTLGPLDLDYYDFSIIYDNNNNNLIDPGSIKPWFSQEYFLNLAKNVRIKEEEMTVIETKKEETNAQP